MPPLEEATHFVATTDIATRTALRVVVRNSITGRFATALERVEGTVRGGITESTPVFTAETHPELHEMTMRALADFRAGRGKRLP